MTLTLSTTENPILSTLFTPCSMVLVTRTDSLLQVKKKSL